MSNTKKNLEEIKEKIRTINPEITDELLDLLYEFVMRKHSIDFKERVSTNNSMQNFINYMINPLDFKNCED